MKNRISLGIAGLALTLSASTAAYADARVRVEVNPFGWWGEPPPVVYAPPHYYAPPTVYYGRGHWGERDGRGEYRGRYDRGRDDRGRSDHHDGGDDRRR
jgi:hypothetical protein